MRKLAFISAIALAAAVSGCSNKTASEEPTGCQPNCGGTQSSAPTEDATEAATAAASEAAK